MPAPAAGAADVPTRGGVCASTGSSAQPRATTTDLYLTITGTGSTAALPAVQDWPGEEDWDAGVLPLAVRVGARFPGGVVVGQSYLFGVTVA